MLMAAWSPTLEGFRTMFRKPSLPLAEVIWRWSFGAAACVLLGLALLAYLDTLPVSNADLMMLRTGYPPLVSQAVSHIFHGSVLRPLVAGVILFLALAFLWIVLASVGRAATLGPLLAHIHDRARSLARERNQDRSPDAAAQSRETAIESQVRSLAGLHFLRVALGVAACAGCVGALILAGFASSRTDPHPGLVLFLVASMTLLIWVLWSTLSWFLAAAPIFVIRESKDTFAALFETASLFRSRAGSVISVGTWFGAAHLILLIATSSVVTFPLAFARLVPPAVVLTAILLLTLTYFAIVDALYIGRLAGYAAILEAPPPATPPPPPPMPRLSIQQSALIPPESAMVDQSETILSDTATPIGAQEQAPAAQIDPTKKSEI
jgi:hypothetical protein